MRMLNLIAAMCFMAALAATDVLDTAEGRWEGHWIEVAATAYTPTNAIDSVYHAAKGTRWRWILADGHTNAKRTPYGVAVKLTQGGDGRWRPALPFGTRLYVPVGSGYLDRSRPESRVFPIDDGSASSQYDAHVDGRMHIDLRWIDTGDAIRWSGDEGHRMLRVFVIERDAPLPPEPLAVWPAAIAEVQLPRIPPAAENAPAPVFPRTWLALLSLAPIALMACGVLRALRSGSA